MSEMTFAGGVPRDRADAPSAPTADRLAHYVSDAPFDPYSVERMTPAQERFYMASEWRMVWWKLRRHRVAVEHPLRDHLESAQLRKLGAEVARAARQFQASGTCDYAQPTGPAPT